MTGADIGIGWIDQNGTVHFQVSKILLFSSVFSFIDIGSICI